jgi:NAD(P)-dependent dehydrogenase (short-subunit alcohol dehydrogenase family)
MPGTALVTGGARRIGRAIALALAHDGWNVAVHYASSREEALAAVAEIEALGRRACAVNRDLAVEAGVKSLLAEVEGEIGRVGCVVNNASLFEYDAAADFGAARLARHMQVNVAAPVLLAQQLAAGLDAKEQGVVINLLDQKLWNPNPDFLSYTLSKAALAEATTLLAQALAPRVRVVGVAPGLTLTSHMLSDDQFQALHQLSPLGRSSTPADVAATVRFALDNQSITGTTLLVDGGQHLQPQSRDVMFLAREAPSKAP